MATFTAAWMAEATHMLRLLPGIFAARFLLDEKGETLEAIHVLAHSARNAKQVVRDVQAALSAAYGLDIDHRIVSVAQMPVNPLLETCAEEAADPPVPARVQYSGLGYEESASRCTVRVTLQYAGASYRGEATGGAGMKWKDHLAAQATVSAVNQLLGEEVYTLMCVQRVQTPAALLAVALVQSQQDEKVLTGAAVMEEGSLHGVVRSALDAVNRNLLWRMVERDNERKRVCPVNNEE